MQQLTIEHEKTTTTDQKVVENTTKKDRRPGKGRTMALSRRIYRLQNTDIFYVESETRDDQYYFVKFKRDVLDSCDCKDNSTRRGLKCKHVFAIEFAIKWGTLKDIDKVPLPSPLLEANKRYLAVVQSSNNNKKSSYLDDDYDL